MSPYWHLIPRLRGVSNHNLITGHGSILFMPITYSAQELQQGTLLSHFFFRNLQVRQTCRASLISWPSNSSDIVGQSVQ